jgi:hypothetical protein
VVTTPAPEPTWPSPATTSPAPAGPTGAPATSSGNPRDTPTTIPDRAFFTQPADTRKEGVDPRFVDDEPLPALCGAGPGDGSEVQRRSRDLVYKYETTPADHVPDGTYRHSIAIHRSGGAQAWLALRRAVQKCPPSSCTVSTRQQLLDDGVRNGSVLFELRSPVGTSTAIRPP